MLYLVLIAFAILALAAAVATSLRLRRVQREHSEAYAVIERLQIEVERLKTEREVKASERYLASLKQMTFAFNSGSDMALDLASMLSDIQESTGELRGRLGEIRCSSEDSHLEMQQSLAKVRSVEGSLKVLQELSPALAEAKKLMDEIVKKSEGISQIAMEAKLLSFNASVEAARAGEHGKGFSVVATEVGKLASSSRDLAAQINSNVQIYTKQIDEVIDRLARQSVEAGEAGGDLMQSLGRLTNVVGGICEVANTAEQASEMSNHRLLKLFDNSKTKMESMIKILADAMGVLSGNPIRDLPAHEAYSQIAHFEIIDVRQKEEYNDELGHIKGARLMTLQNQLGEALAILPRDKKYLFVCRSGGRSAKGARIALSLGFTQVYNLEGGMLAWSKAKLPCEGRSLKLAA